MATAEAKGTPIFMAHGTYDNVIQFVYGKGSCKLLQDAGCDVTWNEYPMQHSACQEELADMAVFLDKVLPRTP